MGINKVFKYVFFDTLRSRLITGYALMFIALGFSLSSFGSGQSKVLVSMLNIMLLVVPLVSVVIGTIHFYNSREFIEMLLAQPVKRSTIFWGEYFGVTIPLAAAFLAGAGIPLSMAGLDFSSLILLFTGALLTFVFAALAFWISLLNNDKAAGIGVSLITWFYFSVVYDGIVLLILSLFNDYPLESAILIPTILNPIDLGRIIVLMQVDISAMMGITGAVFQKLFAGTQGLLIAFGSLILWAVVPALLALRAFIRKDF